MKGLQESNSLPAQLRYRPRKHSVRIHFDTFTCASHSVFCLIEPKKGKQSRKKNQSQTFAKSNSPEEDLLSSPPPEYSPTPDKKDEDGDVEMSFVCLLSPTREHFNIALDRKTKASTN